MSTSIFDQILLRIIREQALIIGPIAWIEARKVSGLKVEDEKAGTLSVEGDGKTVVANLVTQYEKLFGRASREVCKEAVKDIIHDMPEAEVPDSLK